MLTTSPPSERSDALSFDDQYPRIEIDGLAAEDDSFPPPAMAAGLFQRHGWPSPRIAAWLEHQGIDADDLPADLQLAEARGRWRDCMGLPYPWTFQPRSDGPSRAILLPIKEDGATVDVVAIDKADRMTWGVVTGGAAFINRDAIDAADRPLAVHIHPVAWMRHGCCGVVALRYEALPELRRAAFGGCAVGATGSWAERYGEDLPGAGGLIAEGRRHAEQLADRVFAAGLYDPAALRDAAAEAERRIFFRERPELYEDLTEEVASELAWAHVRAGR